MLPIAVSPAGCTSDREAGLELRLVEAGEGAPGVGGLELRRGVPLARPRRPVEAAKGLADLARPVELEHALARGDLAVEAERGGLGLVVVGRVRHLVRPRSRRAR